MKLIGLTVFMALTAAPVFAATADKAPRLFPDAPPPPLIAEASWPFCCTTGGPLTFTSPDLNAAKLPKEGAACEATSSDGAVQTGQICY